MLREALDAGVVAVEFFVECPDDLLLFVELVVDFGQFGVDHGPQDGRHLLPAVVLLLLLGGVGVDGTGAAAPHPQLLNINNSSNSLVNRSSDIIWSPSSLATPPGRPFDTYAGRVSNPPTLERCHSASSLAHRHH